MGFCQNFGPDPLPRGAAPAEEVQEASGNTVPTAVGSPEIGWLYLLSHSVQVGSGWSLMMK